MIAAVVPLHRCRCGASGERVALALRGDPAGEIVVCGTCLAKAKIMLDRVRPVFDAMIAAGIDRPIANETMSFLLGRIDA